MPSLDYNGRLGIPGSEKNPTCLGRPRLGATSLASHSQRIEFGSNAIMSRAAELIIARNEATSAVDSAPTPGGLSRERWRVRRRR
jgi:hypothetical protein